ncbi:MAG: ABC transporter permease [Eubacteriales bacterium]|nr:ABC transporter permease [Eubacteriales bacterium]
MVIWRRAWQKNKDSKVTVILLLIVFSLTLAVLLQNISLLAMTREAQANMNRRQSGAVRLLADTDESDIGINGQTLPMDFLQKLTAREGVRLNYASGTIPAYVSGLEVFRLSEIDRRNKEAMHPGYDFEKAQDTTIIAVSSCKNYPEYKNETLSIVEGRGITSDDEDNLVAVISDVVAKKNGLSPGDKVSYRVWEKEEGQELTFEIVGIHSDGSDMNGLILGSAGSTYHENLVFIPLETGSQVSPDGFLTELEISLDQAAKSEALIEWIWQEQPLLMQTVKLVNQNYTYQEQNSIFAAQQRYQGIVIRASYGIAIAVLSLFLNYLLSGRKREFGIMSAMGERCIHVIVQVFFELCVPFFISIPTGLFTAILMMRKIQLPQMILDYSGSEAKIRMRDFFQAFGMEVILLFMGVIFAAIIIFRNKPMELLRGCRE